MLIAVLLPDLRGGGVERMRIQLAKEWLARGLKVEFVLLQAEGALLPLLPQGATVRTLGTSRYRNAVKPLLRYLQTSRPDVLLAAMWPLTVVAVLAARLSRLPLRVVISDHNTLSNAHAGRGRLHRLFLRASMALMYPLADGRIAVSRGVAADLSALSGIRMERFEVVYNPAATPQKQALDLQRPADLPAATRLILGVGSLKQQKDHALLIEAFSRLPADLDAYLCILGEGVLRRELEATVAAKGLSGRVTLPGFRPEPGAYFRAADVFVLSSRYEGFGNVIVEALEQGVPVVSTDCPAGPREILEDGKYGRLVAVGDARALARAIEAALREKPDRKALQNRAQDFSVEKIASRYIDVMRPSAAAKGAL